MQKNTPDFGTETISRILLRIAPPVMLALLIQALYNVVDSCFVGKFSDDALTALSVVFPMQFLIIAVAVGTGVGVNNYMARKYALGRTREADAAAGTVLGLYYKLQNFFFIPLFGLQTCIVPLLSYNCAAQKYARCRETVHKSPLISASLMLVGAACFILLPGALIGIFSRSAEVLAIGRIAFPTIGASFSSAAFSLIMPTFFQAIGCGGRSLAVTLTRQIFGLLPVFWLLSLIGLNYTWLAFPVAEMAAGALGYIMYRRQLKVWK